MTGETVKRSQSDENVPYERMTLVERCARTFDSFLDRDFSTRFYNEAFLDGISRRRAEIHARVGKLAGATLFLSILLALFELISGSVSYAGVTVQITQDLLPVVSLMAASGMLACQMAFIDDQIIVRILMKIGSRINIHSFPLLLVDKVAINLWSDAFTPRHLGPRSGTAQKGAFAAVLILFILIGSFYVLFPLFMINRVAWELFNSRDALFIAKAISFLAAFISWLAVALIVTFIIRFKFYDADFHEATLEPTDSFTKRMQERMRGDEIDPPSQ